MKTLFLVGLGGGLGAIARHLIGRLALQFPHGGFPLSTFVVNVLGSLAMGFLVGWLAFEVDGGRNLRLFLGVGLLGGFTTFSAFSLEMVQMVERKNWLGAGVYAGSSMVLAVLALMLGLVIARKMFAG